MAVWHWPTYIMLGVAFFLGYAILDYADKCSQRDKYQFLLILALLPTYLVLANRGMTVGNDLVRYEIRVSNALANGFPAFELLSEPLMQAVYITSKALPGYPMRNFIVLTVTIQYIFIFLSLYLLHENKLPTALSFGLFWCSVMIRSTSMVSNALALACALCAYVVILNPSKKSKILYWIFTAIAIGFHNSALVNIPLYFILLPFSDKEEQRKKQYAFIAALFIAYVLLYVLLATGFLNTLLKYIAGGQYERSLRIQFKFGIGNSLLRAPLLLLTVMIWLRLSNKYKSQIEILFRMLVSDLLISQMRYLNNNFERFSLYTALGPVLLIPILLDVFQENIERRICESENILLSGYTVSDRRAFVANAVKVVSIAGLLFSFTYYLYRWAIGGNYGIMPYQFWGK